MDDYRSAALRHLKDAESLRVVDRLDNAGHLVGFAAECAIKYRIATLQATADPHGHFPEFLTIARKHLGQRSNYTSMYDIIRNPVFQAWTVHRRYWKTGSTTLNEVDQWFAQTKRLMAAAQIRGEG
ncbi:hypothetical protein [Burkholderia ubonensis]|uniref:hypothetical protein n=1 Tax=Burkholderia ubonensis TaxID=101571 RepID=UPI00075C359A|nr:hypothetical protein [Burkholderia ubonensis]KWC65261.1 hypothetical protein WL54_05770 [Burkholderia ubonensis]KWE98689.1 hypothetical protein WL82_22550 [Burkholderia ubonensis]KWI84447.1 hypothetical protein WM09_19660 [Burkholderia ubonensis]KWO90880.1 hypothetical protein WM32_04340 [Burkholderia ubonensis]OJB03826.1 hypothetical protein BGV52_31320 [Burkholderia ubonensis]